MRPSRLPGISPHRRTSHVLSGQQSECATQSLLPFSLLPLLPHIRPTLASALRTSERNQSISHLSSNLQLHAEQGDQKVLILHDAVCTFKSNIFGDSTLLAS